MAKKPTKTRSKAARRQSGAVHNKRPKKTLSKRGSSKGLAKRSNLPEILNNLTGLPPEAVKLIAASVRRSSFSGPLPRPADLKEYKELIQDGAERIMVMAEIKLAMEEREQEKRNQHIDKALSNERLRIHYSVVVALAFVAGAVVCVFYEQYLLAIILGSSGIGSALVRGLTERGKARKSRN